MAQRVFLHVGSPKTGTTFLQDVLWAGRDTALAQGLLLPLGSFDDHYLATLDVRTQTARTAVPDRARGIWGRLADEVRAWPGDVLVSHELLAGANEEEASRAIAALGDVDVHVVVTARDLERQIPAEWQEHIKHRASLSFSEFVQRLRTDESGSTWFWTVQDYAAVCRRWGGSLPPGNTHVVTVPARGAEPLVLWSRFAGLVGLDPQAFDFTVSRSNTSLGAEQTELLRRVNAGLGDRLPLRGRYARPVKEVLAQDVLAGRGGTAVALSGRDREFAIQRSTAIVEQLRGLRVDVVGDLAELVPAEQPASGAAVTDHPESTSESMLLTEAVEALAGLLDRLADEQELRSDAERSSSVAQMELNRAKGELSAVQHRLADIENERDALRSDMQQRPIRHLLIGLSGRYPRLMRMRVRYWRTANVLRAVLRLGRDRDEGTPD